MRPDREEVAFLTTLPMLSDIPGVEDFEIAGETSLKNEFTFVVSMNFADQAAYDAYDNHPVHLSFVRDRWATEVAAFMENDTVGLEAG